MLIVGANRTMGMTFTIAANGLEECAETTEKTPKKSRKIKAQKVGPKN